MTYAILLLVGSCVPQTNEYLLYHWNIKLGNLVLFALLLLKIAHYDGHASL